jgi:hypothetical protein
MAVKDYPSISQAVEYVNTVHQWRSDIKSGKMARSKFPKCIYQSKLGRHLLWQKCRMLEAGAGWLVVLAMSKSRRYPDAQFITKKRRWEIWTGKCHWEPAVYVSVV